VARLKSQRRRRQAAQQAIDTKTCSFRNSLARCVHQAKHDPEAIFELRCGPREYRWQGLEVPAMMGKRHGTALLLNESTRSVSSAFQ
jgi:hypothetical protein